jgi:hypothetical protein
VALRVHKPTTDGIIFNFPLSLMERETALIALDLALVDLGTDLGSEAEARHEINATHILEAIYFNEGDLPLSEFDINRDGVVDLLDAVRLIDRSSER